MRLFFGVRCVLVPLCFGPILCWGTFLFGFKCLCWVQVLFVPYFVGPLPQKTTVRMSRGGRGGPKNEPRDLPSETKYSQRKPQDLFKGVYVSPNTHQSWQTFSSSVAHIWSNRKPTINCCSSCFSQSRPVILAFPPCPLPPEPFLSGCNSRQLAFVCPGLPQL